jgi:Helicase C-terminal domain
MTEGLDLHDDLSRFQVVVKVPYPNFTDPYIAVRKRLDRDWYLWQTAMRLIQATGTRFAPRRISLKPTSSTRISRTFNTGAATSAGMVAGRAGRTRRKENQRECSADSPGEGAKASVIC